MGSESDCTSQQEVSLARLPPGLAVGLASHRACAALSGRASLREFARPQAETTIGGASCGSYANICASHPGVRRTPPNHRPPRTEFLVRSPVPHCRRLCRPNPSRTCFELLRHFRVRLPHGIFPWKTGQTRWNFCTRRELSGAFHL